MNEEPARVALHERNEAQREAARSRRVRRFLHAHRDVLSQQGSVRETWRTTRGKKRGPYFRLVWRETSGKGQAGAARRRRGLYLGRSEELARKVRRTLAYWQQPKRDRRQLARCIKHARASLRQDKRQLQQFLATKGIEMKGWEFRGVRKALPLPPKRRLPRLPLSASPRPHDPHDLAATALASGAKRIPSPQPGKIVGLAPTREAGGPRGPTWKNDTSGAHTPPRPPETHQH